ncbi:MAG: 16S rRNA (guanine(527)-N(7))-methyltransferase RsmG [Gammaproteobacteria bacterium]|nr:16S rRNA (guanine(527)-N(7))-methyltransferase RsmG [Gammaproteobacteria bacterium]NIR98831.1 16S rRNA (guanine(527)-N(7))-methyltransferase RsmG [Gammaproteobacteria bacterium]
MPAAPSPRALLEEGLEGLGLALASADRDRLLQYLELLRKWNRVYNLTAVRTVPEMVTRHLLDALAVLPHVQGARVLDVGTGAGLPGIPLAVVSPDRRFTLLDASAKKIRFVTQAAAELHLANVTPVHRRVEDFRPPQPFDTVIARAFSALAQLTSSAGPLCRSGGRILAMKGAYPAGELADLPPGYAVADVVPLHVPGLDAQRHLVVVVPDGR